MDNLLTQHLAKRDETLAAFAARIGRSHSSLSRLMRGQRNPSLNIAIDVERGTRGVIKANAFLDLCAQARRKKLSAVR
jgi:antitoxin HigA-1